MNVSSPVNIYSTSPIKFTQTSSLCAKGVYVVPMLVKDGQSVSATMMHIYLVFWVNSILSSPSYTPVCVLTSVVNHKQFIITSNCYIMRTM